VHRLLDKLLVCCIVVLRTRHPHHGLFRAQTESQVLVLPTKALAALAPRPKLVLPPRRVPNILGKDQNGARHDCVVDCLENVERGAVQATVNGGVGEEGIGSTGLLLLFEKRRNGVPKESLVKAHIVAFQNGQDSARRVGSRRLEAPGLRQTRPLQKWRVKG